MNKVFEFEQFTLNYFFCFSSEESKWMGIIKLLFFIFFILLKKFCYQNKDMVYTCQGQINTLMWRIFQVFLMH